MANQSRLKESLKIRAWNDAAYGDLIKELLIAHVKNPATEYYDAEGTVTKGQPGVYPIGHGESITVPWQQEEYQQNLPKLQKKHEQVYH
tara:strand:- start:157 stop:423 length:267 start_codon:yes stop_codon:yes gene_type:complete